jgi:hypothetical protein
MVFPNHLAEKHLLDFISLASYVHASPTVRQLTPERCHFESVPVNPNSATTWHKLSGLQIKA